MAVSSHIALDLGSSGLIVPGDPGWDAARQAWNLAVDQRPAAVALPESAADVIAAVTLARKHGLRVAARGTGHGAAALGALEDAILVNTSRMTGVTIDPGARRARVEAGTLWQDVTVPAAEHGLAALAGSAADIGVVGYTLGGGVGWLGRRHGLAANSVVGVELVAADGRLLRVDSEHEPDLFWALRGGGGSFGVVTAIEFELYPIQEVYAGALFWPLDRAADVLHAWARWTGGLPDELTSLGRLLRFPPLPEIPEPLRGGSFAVVEAAHLGSEAEAAELLAPLRELKPQLDTFAPIPPPALQAIHMDPEGPTPFAGDGAMLTGLPPAAVDAFLDAAGPGSSSPLLSVELRHLGGALSRAAPHHGALATLDGSFLMFALGIAPDAQSAAGVEAHARAVQTALAPWRTRLDYANFSERRADAGHVFAPHVHRRLRAVKTQVDPQDLFQASHHVAPTAQERTRESVR
jgi:FAD/FMN-containing dehydrogenase